eukprot:6743248-Heterocapsa_arctica.AAC.1
MADSLHQKLWSGKLRQEANLQQLEEHIVQLPILIVANAMRESITKSLPQQQYKQDVTQLLSHSLST